MTMAMIKTTKKRYSKGGSKRKTPRKRIRRIIPANKEYILESSPNSRDVVSGRGGGSNHHPGNSSYWQMILNSRESYKACQIDEDKTEIAQRIVSSITCANGRFLQKEAKTGRWFVLPGRVVLDKVKQALRDAYIPIWARIGRRVRISGLVDENNANGRSGVIVTDGRRSNDKRWTVVLDDQQHETFICICEECQKKCISASDQTKCKSIQDILNMGAKSPDGPLQRKNLLVPKTCSLCSSCGETENNAKSNTTTGYTNRFDSVTLFGDPSIFSSTDKDDGGDNIASMIFNNNKSTDSLQSGGFFLDSSSMDILKIDNNRSLLSNFNSLDSLRNFEVTSKGTHQFPSSEYIKMEIAKLYTNNSNAVSVPSKFSGLVDDDEGGGPPTATTRLSKNTTTASNNTSSTDDLKIEIFNSQSVQPMRLSSGHSLLDTNEFSSSEDRKIFSSTKPKIMDAWYAMYEQEVVTPSVGV